MRDWLRALRKAKGMTQSAVAQRLGVAKPVISRWESATRRPTYDKMLALADLLGPEVMERFASESKSDGRVA